MKHGNDLGGLTRPGREKRLLTAAGGTNDPAWGRAVSSGLNQGKMLPVAAYCLGPGNVPAAVFVSGKLIKMWGAAFTHWM